MIPDVGHYLSWNMASASQRLFRHLWTAFFLLFFVFSQATAFLLDFSALDFMSERISLGGMHRDIHPSKDNTHNRTSRSTALLVLRSGQPAYFGEYGTESANVFYFAMLHSARLVPLPSLLLAFVRLEICPSPTSPPLLLAKTGDETRPGGHGDEGARGDVFRS